MTIKDLINLVQTLREKCPWDRQQTLMSLKNKVIEEAYELVEAIEQDDSEAMTEEIGDLIFLGFFMARMLEDEKQITVQDLITSVVEKYKEKHPHVYKDKNLKTSDDVLAYWHRSKEDVFRGIALALPALLAAKTIQERASKLGFDWKTHAGPLEKVREELQELSATSDKSAQFEEYGDLLFACVNYARHVGIDPEDALRHANKKFVMRFRKVMEELKKQGKDVNAATLEEMDAVWDKIKSQDE